jgi:hypothetical protein
VINPALDYREQPKPSAGNEMDKTTNCTDVTLTCVQFVVFFILNREDRKENNFGSFSCRAIRKVARIKDGIHRMIWHER